MRTLPITISILLLASTARADAISPFDGECPPGSQKGVVSHSEACIPLACQSDAQCGAGASCQTICVCNAERELTSDGRVVYPEPIRRVVEVGPCDVRGQCVEGEAAQRKQCEPNEATDAFDRMSHRWTGRPYVHASGCSVSRSPATSVGAWVIAALVLVRRRR